MKAEKIQDAIGMIGDDLIEDAKNTRRVKKHRAIKWVASVAAILAVIITANFVFDMPISLQVYAITEAEYPEMAQCPDYEKYQFDYGKYSELYDQWREECKERRNQYEGYNEGLDGFFTKSITEFLSDSQNENKVYSPLNVYMALSMLAETTDTNSRQQILDLLGSDSIESLRRQANAIWNANYWDDGTVTSILANSLWLNENIDFKMETLENITDNYFASSYKGKMGSEDYNKALQSWLNEQTGGLLKDQINNIEMNPDTVLALASTIYFKASWDNEFREKNTVKDVFHTANGDVTCDFMKQSYARDYYWGEKFSAVKQTLQNSGGMWLILPDEGVTVDELLSDAQTMEFILADDKWENGKYLTVNLSVPKFDVTSQIDLTDGLKNLGITDVFDSAVSDFSPLMENSDGIAVSQAQHGARVMIDEEGCTATAFTVMSYAGSAMPPTDEIDFTVDRPFIFVITSQDGLPLFVGVVNQPI